MDHDEDDYDPHTPVVPETNILTLSGQGNEPAEELVLPTTQAGLFGVEGEAGEYHGDAADSDDGDHNQMRQRIVSDVFFRFLFHEGVPSNLVPQLFPE